MEERKWEELPEDCLVEVFVKVGIESIIESVVVVCKSWHKASLTPQCWQKIVLTKIPAPIEWGQENGHDPDGMEAFIKFVISRSHGTTTVVAFPRCYQLTKGVLNCLAKECPYLKSLSLPSPVLNGSLKIRNLIRKLKNLETLELGSEIDGLGGTIDQSRKFVHLTVRRVNIYNGFALHIATQQSNVKFLDLRHSTIERGDLILILQGCKKLEYLDVSSSDIRFKVDDEILKLASHITTFKYEHLPSSDQLWQRLLGWIHKLIALKTLFTCFGL